MVVPHWLAIAFLFLVGASVGSFVNVVVYRLPRSKSVVWPPSACPHCGHRLAWHDNLPIIGWLLLRGQCGYCRRPISERYPTVELITALLFVGTYAALFLFGLGPCAPGTETVNRFGETVSVPGGLTFARDWWLLIPYLALVAALLAASLIDAELFIIPLGIPWFIAIVGVASHATFDRPGLPGSIAPSSGPLVWMAFGGGIGLLVSLLLLRANLIRRSFADGEPTLDHPAPMLTGGSGRYRTLWLSASDLLLAVIGRRGKIPPAEPVADVPQTPVEPLPERPYSRAELNREMRHEMLFLLPPMVLAGVLGVLALRTPAVAELGERWAATPGLGGFAGALLGMLVGALGIWLIRIGGTLMFGKEAMGMGDVHLLFGVGAVLGAGMTAAVPYLAAVSALPIALALLVLKWGRQVPFGPYLAAGSVLAMLLQCALTRWATTGHL